MYNLIQMDYQALASIIPKPAHQWTQQHVMDWLHFVHLQSLASIFSRHRINGQALLKINAKNLQQIGITNSIIQRKLIRWIKEGFTQFQYYLNQKCFQDKQNIPPLQRKITIEKETLRNKPLKLSFKSKEEDSMVIRSCDGNLAAFYIMKEKVLKIGRSNINTIRSLQVSVEDEHAQIFKNQNKYYIRDQGTQAGTFIKILHPHILQLNTLIQMGSFLIQIQKIQKQSKLIILNIIHMVSKQICQLSICLKENCNSFSFGRRKTNNFSFDDQHLSGMHARIFILHGQFVIEDLHSTNGTWLRLSKQNQTSDSYLLGEGCIFKIGTTITYQCQENKPSQMKMQIEYDDNCINCNNEKKNIVFVPCRHNLICYGCSHDITECPTCKSIIQQKIKIYI